MSDTVFDTSNNTAVQKEAYAKKAWLWAQEDMYFGPMIAKVNTKGQNRVDKSSVRVARGSDGLITMNDQLRVEKGSVVNFNILAPLSGAGRVDDEWMEGYEEDLTYYDFSVTIHYRKNAVVVPAMSEQRTFKNVREDASAATSMWLAQITDTDLLMALSGLANSVGTLAAVAPSTNRKWFGGQTVADVLNAESGDGSTYTLQHLGDASAADDANYLFGPRVIEAVHRKAKIAGEGYPKMRPFRVKGKDYYIMFIHPYQTKALEASAAWQTAVTLAAYPVPDHPMFTGAIGNWNGVILKEWDKIETRIGSSGDPATSYFESGDAADATYTAMVARALFCGAQAGVIAVGSNIRTKEQERDYGDRWGVKTGMMFGPGKPRFNGEDYGVIAVHTCIIPD